MTDPGMADATYIGPMTPELVEQILDKVGVGGGECGGNIWSRQCGAVWSSLLGSSRSLWIISINIIRSSCLWGRVGWHCTAGSAVQLLAKAVHWCGHGR
jgi:hypothetical protein